MTIFCSLITYFLFEAPYRSLYRYYFESPRLLSLLSPTLHLNGSNGKAGFSNPALNLDGDLRLGANNHNNNGNGVLASGVAVGNGAETRVQINGVSHTSPNSDPSSKASKKIKSRELNPNFLFSPHYNLVTNASSRAESENSSLSNFPMDSVGGQHYSQNPNPDVERDSRVKGFEDKSGDLSAASCESMASGDTRIAGDDPNNNCGDSAMPSAPLPPTIVIDH